MSSPLKRSNANPGTSARILFVCHEATRTGAPKIALSLLKHFDQNTSSQCDAILHNGGCLKFEFENHSKNTFCVNLALEDSDKLRRRVRRAVNRDRRSVPDLAICNSMETRHIAAALKRQLNLPIMFLVHELPSSYSVNDYHTVFDISDQLIFPAQTVWNDTNAKTPVPRDRSHILPQGLLDPDFGKSVNRESARCQLREELSIPQDAFIVLGCGTLDLRKGIDHFAAVARQVVRSGSSSRPIHFVWLGEGPRWVHSAYHYVVLDLEKAGARDHVHFIGERHNVAPCFLGSDVFMMTSRVDPFPCVIHESMAAGLPIVSFDNNGGTHEAINEGCGIVVPYADYESAAQTIQKLCDRPALIRSVTAKSKSRVNVDYRFENYADRLVVMAEQLMGKSIRQSNPSALAINRAA